MEDTQQPTLLYDSPTCQVWCGDSLPWLAAMQNESVQLVLTDPPYGVAFRSNMRADRFDAIAGDGGSDDEYGKIRSILGHAARVTAQSRHLYVFGPARLVDGLVVSATTELVWDKGGAGMGDLSSAWGPQHEPITFCVTASRHAGKAGKDNLAVRLRKGTVLKFPRRSGLRYRHPTEKPVPLLRELIESSSRAGDLVLDPFAGSGSTAVAAILAGRRATICELDPEHAAVAVERVRRAEEVAALASAC